MEDQPTFAELVDTLRDGKHPLTIVVGWGPSYDAGVARKADIHSTVEHPLPSITRTTNFNEEQGGRARDDRDLSLAPPDSSELASVIYSTQGVGYGELADAIASLALTYPARTQIVTTALDDCIEQAITRCDGSASRQFSLDEADAWQSLPAEDARRCVMHLGGHVSRNAESTTDVAFATWQWAGRGERIAKILRAAAQQSTVLVVGASLANLAITTGLFSGTWHRVYWALTPKLSVNNTGAELASAEETLASVAVTQGNRLQDAYGIRPILLKSYSQVSQLVTECVLASKYPSRYRGPCRGVPKNQSVKYGLRFNTAISEAYRALGASQSSGSIPASLGMTLSQALHASIWAPSGPVSLLREMARRYEGDCAATEHFGVFIWLRDNPARSDARYALRLMLTSVYAHWDEWSSFRLEPINESNRNAAVQACFYGRSVFSEIDPKSHSGMWQGAFAYPLTAIGTVLEDTMGPRHLDRVAIGAVALNTDRRLRSNSSSVSAHDMSVLSVLSQREMHEFTGTLRNVVQSLF